MTDHRDPEDHADPQTLRDLEAAMRSLPRLTREIFLAARLDAMSYAEIASRTGLTVEQVQKLIANALAALDRELCGARTLWRRRLRLFWTRLAGRGGVRPAKL